MADERINFIGEVRNRWITEQLGAGKEQMGDLYPRIVPFVVRVVALLDTHPAFRDDAELSTAMKEVKEAGLHWDKIFSIAHDSHISWRRQLANERYSPEHPIH